jgi:hypothetical protein
MKKKYIIFILILSIFSTEEIYSQESYLGVKGGVNIPFVNFTDFVIDTRLRTGVFPAPYFGITYRYMHQPKIGLQIELAYSGKGWQNFSTNGEGITNFLRTEINYIEVPVYLHWAIIGNRKFKFNIDLGVYAAYALNATTTIDNGQDLEQLFLRYDYETDNRGDFGLVMGASFSYDFKFGTLELGGSFKTGFANILPVSYILKENPVVSTNQVPTISLSYLLPLSKFSSQKDSTAKQKVSE